MMKLLSKFVVVFGILGGIGYASYQPIVDYIAERNKPRWRTATVSTGTITKTVDAIGSIRPTKLVQVGSFVSGPIKDLFVEHNQNVKEGEILAKIDPQLFAANVARDEATLATRKADLQRVKALLQQAKNDERRANALREQNVDFIAQSELDQVMFGRMSLDAQKAIAEASIEQAEATLVNSRANLNYCEIRSPEDGMIIKRLVEPGQTLAAQFTTPEMFQVGVGMREKMHVMADVDESEIGLIRDAADRQQPVTFSVTAYPDDEFQGTIEEVRFSSSELQTVVTYPVVVGSPNPDLKLLPGMTADLSFQIEKKENLIRIPKSALRFYPPDKKHVREEDQGLLEGEDFDATPKEENISEVDEKELATEVKEADENAEQSTRDDKSVKSAATLSSGRVKSLRKKQKRHVWIVKDDVLHAVEVKIGLSDSFFSELVEGDIKVDDELVTGLKTKDEK